MVPHFDFNVFDRQVIHIASYTGEMLSAGPKQFIINLWWDTMYGNPKDFCDNDGRESV